MALNLGNMFYQLGVKSQGLQTAEKDVRRFRKNANREFKAVGRSAMGLGKIFASLITLEAGRRTLLLADKYAVLKTRIKTATKATNDYGHAMRELGKISNRTGSSFATNVSLFQNLARIAPSIGASNNEILRLTESFSQLAAIGGSDANDMKFALRQLGQAMASGIVRAEEFNSIIENTPEIAARIAKGMGMGSAQLRLMVLDGKVLSKDVYQSLIKQTAEIAEEFKKLPPTIGRAGETMKNSFGGMINQFDEAFGITVGIATAMNKVSEIMRQDWTPAIMRIQGLFDEIGWWFDDWMWSVKQIGDVFGIEFGSAGGFVKDFFGTVWFGWKKIFAFMRELPLSFPVWMAQMAGAYDKFTMDLAAVWGSTIIGFKIGWEEIGYAATNVGNNVELVWAKIIDNIKLMFADAAQGIIDLAEELPFVGDQIGKNGRQFVADLRKAADYTKEIEAEIQADEIAHRKKISELLKEDQDLRKGVAGEGARIDAEIEALKAAANARRQQREADIAASKEKREADYKASKEKIALEEAENAKIDAENKKYNLEYSKRLEEKREEEKANQEAMKELKKISKDFDRLQEELATERELENQHYAEQIETLQAAQDAKIASIVPYHELRERLEAEHQARLVKMEKDKFSDAGQIEKIAYKFGIDLTKNKNAEQLREDGKAFEKQIDAAAQHSKEFFMIKKAMALATAMIEAPKAIMSAYTFGSAIGGPPVAAVFAGMAAAATAVQISAIAGASFQGGRRAGGPVSAGSAYRVNENGPELLESGGNSYLMMGSQGGTVTPNNKLGGGSGGDVFVEIIDQRSGGEQVQAETSTNDQGDQVIRLTIKDTVSELFSTGEMDSTMRNNYNLSRQGV